MNGMAGNVCHAAGQPSYEVRELHDGDPPIDLGVRYRCDDFLDASDFALDYLEENDPLREGLVSALEIVRIDGERREIVTAYRFRDTVAPHPDLAAQWGFPVAAWRGPAEHRPRRP